MKVQMKQRMALVQLSVLCSGGMMWGAPAYAQDVDCVKLHGIVRDAGNDIRDEFNDVQSVVIADIGANCRRTLARITDRGGLTSQTDSVQSLNTAVVVEQQATIEGQVNVTLPDPEVSIDQGQADVAVTTEASRVTVSQGQPVIQVRQAQPIITVSMGPPTIQIEQPAPEITIIMPDPSVDVSNARPQVSINIPEPRVTVRQGEPKLNVDLNTGASNSEQLANLNDRPLARVDEAGIMTVTAAGVAVDENTANINFVEPETSATVTYEGVEPKVQYIAAEPEVIMQASAEPEINVVHSGDPKIVIKQAMQEEPGSLAADSTNTQAGGMSWNPTDAFAPDASRLLEGDAGSIVVADLEGMDVINARDEKLGVVDRVVKNGNGTYVIIEHGGWFFGLNDKEVAFPLDAVVVSGKSVLLRGLSEEQIEAMPDYNYDNEVSLASDDSLEMTIISN